MLKSDDRSRDQIDGHYWSVQLPLQSFLSSSPSIRFNAAAESPVVEKSLLEKLCSVGHKDCVTLHIPSVIHLGLCAEVHKLSLLSPLFVGYGSVNVSALLFYSKPRPKTLYRILSRSADFSA